jgi:RNA polymerase sigma-70 factor, ECF subfamily
MAYRDEGNAMTEDRPDFQEIYKSFHPKIVRYIERLAGPLEAEDLAQEVFVRIDRSLEGFRGESRLSTWIYRIATNVVLDWLRSSSYLKMTQKKPLEDLTAEEEESGSAFSDENPPSPEQQAIRAEMIECIQGFVQDLPENYRTVLILSEMEELPNSEIAEILDLTLDAVKIRLHRARARLKKALDLHCSFYHDERNELACDRKSLISKPDRKI